MNTLSKAAAIVSGALLVVVATPAAWAQETPPPVPVAPLPAPVAVDPAPPAAIAPPAAPAPLAPVPAAAAPAAAVEPVRAGGGLIEKDLDRYWGEKRQVRVVERLLHPKDGRHELGLLGGIIPNDDFLFYYTAGVRYGYFASESISFELTYAKPFLQDTELGQFLVDNFGQKIDEVQENDRYQHMAHVNLVWTPFYGKLAFLTRKLVHFDLGVFVGAGWLNTNYQDQESSEDVSRQTIEGNVGAGFRFHILDELALRFDVHQYFFKKVQGGLSHPTMLSIGFSTLLPHPVRNR